MPLPGVLSWYKTPSYVDLKNTVSLLAQNESKLSQASSPRSSLDLGERGGIPPTLTLERVLANKTCSPMSLYDFYMYLKHIEYSPENLEFYLWFKDYERRWTKSNANSNSKTPYSHDGPNSQSTLNVPTKQFSNKPSLARNDSDATSYDMEKGIETSLVAHLITVNPRCDKCGSHPDSKNADSDSDQQFDFQTELETMIQEYLLPDSPKELNLPSSMRQNALAALRESTSPEHLKPIAAHTYAILKSCSHRNFIRLGVGNGTFETLCIATSLGIVLTIAGFLYMILLAFATNPGHLHAVSRWKGLGAFPLWWLGLSFILSGARGSCFFLLLFSRRQPLPWERFGDGAVAEESAATAKQNVLLRFMKRMMIFDRKMRVKDKHLRSLQTKIVIQSVAGGFFFSLITCVFWLSLPIWKV